MKANRVLVYSFWILTFLFQSNVSAQVVVPQSLSVQSHSIELDGKAKTIAKEYARYLNENYRIPIKRSGSSGKAEEVASTGLSDQVFALNFDVKGKGQKSVLSVKAVDQSGKDLGNGSVYSKLDESLKSFAKFYYKELVMDELKKAQKVSSKENKGLNKLVENKEKTEKQIEKKDSEISKAESKILKIQQKMKDLENDLVEENKRIEEAQKARSDKKRELIEVNNQISAGSKNVEGLKKKEQEIQEKIKKIESL
jgi:hypothetical protein